MKITDEALMQAVREGDFAQLGVLFDRHHREIFDFLVRTTGQRAVAEDLVQDVFERILKYRSTYRGDAGFRPWMYRIACNARADHYRRKVPTTAWADEFEPADESAGPERTLEEASDAQRLQRALNTLREEKRELLMLARFGEMKYEAIAEVFGVDTGTIKVRVHRALKELRDAFLKLDSRPPCNVKKFPSGTPTI
jgi:RNA polymerase sigma-70 factor (ECF subfamily)